GRVAVARVRAAGVGGPRIAGRLHPAAGGRRRLGGHAGIAGPVRIARVAGRRALDPAAWLAAVAADLIAVVALLAAVDDPVAAARRRAVGAAPVGLAVAVVRALVAGLADADDRVAADRRRRLDHPDHAQGVEGPAAHLEPLVAL